MRILTTCSSRKAAPTPPQLEARSLPQGTLDEVAGEWMTRLATAIPTTRSAELYSGRGFGHAKAAAKGAPFIVSAGLGILDPNTLVPSYGVTVSYGPEDDVFRRVTGRRDPAGWWHHVGRSRYAMPLSGLFEGSGLILAALSASYIAMLQDDLVALSGDQLGRLRLFSATPAEDLPAYLRPQLMPYGQEINAPSSPYRGVIADFAPRALRHFVETVLPGLDDADPQTHSAAVRKAFA